jgi:biopolymer transport protein ExbD
MGMNMGGGGNESADPEVMVDMNTTPLIDVMLVLLIMLIITIPIQLHSVNLDMPAGKNTPPATTPEVVKLNVEASGVITWNAEPLPDKAALEARLRAAAAQREQPEVHLRPDQAVPYKSVAAVMAAAQRIGVTKIGIVGSEQFIDQ